MINFKEFASRALSFTLAAAVFAAQFVGVTSIKAANLRDVVSENAVYIIRNVATGRVMDIPNGEDKNNLQLQTWEYNGSPAQQYKFIECEDTGWYYIIPQCAKTKALDDPYGSKDDGVRHQIYQQNGNVAQEYCFQDVGDGRYRIVSNSGEKALQDEDKAVVQRSISNDERQFWRLEQIRVDYTFSNAIKYDGADPWVVKAGNYYYLISTGGDITIQKAKNLEDIGTAKPYTVYSGDSIYNGETLSNYWAPELIWLQDHWYIYFAPEVDHGGNDSHRMYCLQGGTNPNNPLDGEYVCKGRVADWNSNKWAIDGTAFTFNGQNYFVWSGWEGDANGQQRLYISAMSDPWTLSTGRVTISVPDHDWETNEYPHVNEGPEAIVRNGKVYIIYSGSGSWTDNYCLGLLTCSDGNVLNPSSWVKEDSPVFKKTESVFGVGHASFVQSKDGTEDWIVYHAAKSQGSGWDRNIRIQSFTWKNDKPFFGEPIAGDVMVGKPSSNNETYVEEGRYYMLQNVGTGRFMDIPNGDDLNSLQLQTWTGNESAAQQFAFIKRSTGWYTIAPKCAPGRALDNPMGSTDRNVIFQTWEQNNNIAQNFRIEKLTDSAFRIINQASLFALTDTGESGSYKVHQQVLTNSENQQWRIIEVQKKPVEVIGLITGSENYNSITVSWGQSDEAISLGQKYNIYLDGSCVYSEVNCEAFTLNNISAGSHTIKVTAVLNGVETSGAESSVNVEDQPTTTEPETTTQSETTTEPETTTQKKEAEIVIDGYQISTMNKGHRVIYSVSDPDSEVVSVGMIYGLRDKITENDMVLNSTNSYIYSYEATEAGRLPVTVNEIDGATSYAMTMKYHETAEYYNARLSMRAYAVLSNGSVIYSDASTTSVYSIAEAVYENRWMPTAKQHEFLYNDILKVVNPSYLAKEYDWSSAIVQ